MSSKITISGTQMAIASNPCKTKSISVAKTGILPGMEVHL
jgi:hypothetical protein